MINLTGNDNNLFGSGVGAQLLEQLQWRPAVKSASSRQAPGGRTVWTSAVQ